MTRGIAGMLLMIDNYDSFTYNIVRYLNELHSDVEVIKNDELSVEQIAALRPSKIVLSPGPGTPDDAGVCMGLVKKFAGVIPILGVCLGHQCIAQMYGAEVTRAAKVMHGKTSEIYHDGLGVYRDIEGSFVATRYHSLIVSRTSFPDCLEITAWVEDKGGQKGEIMGIRHKDHCIEGVQFHPEAVLSQRGHQIFENFIRQ